MATATKKSALDAIKLLEAQREQAIQAAMDKYESEQKKLLDAAKDELHARLKTIRNALDGYNTDAKELGLNIYALVKGDYAAEHNKAAGGRVRRSADECKAIAEKAVAFLKTQGKTGASKAEIEKAAGGKLAPTPFDFVKKFAGIEIEFSGAKANRRYFHAK